MSRYLEYGGSGGEVRAGKHGERLYCLFERDGGGCEPVFLL